MCKNLGILSLVYIAVFVAVVSAQNGNSSSEDITDVSAVGRTFGHNALKRLSFIFLPVMFTLGVISTLLMALAVISVKNLAIGVMLLIVSVSQAVSRLFATAIPAPAPVILQPRTELFPAPVAAPWPAPGPLLSPWARSDTDHNTMISE